MLFKLGVTFLVIALFGPLIADIIGFASRITISYFVWALYNPLTAIFRIIVFVLICKLINFILILLRK